jgi:hypothetical protein
MLIWRHIQINSSNNFDTHVLLIFHLYLFFSSNRVDHKHSHYNLHSHYHPSGYAFHHNSFDELSTLKMNRNLCQQESSVRQHEYQWPKVIPKSPSSFSMNSIRMNCQSPFDRSSNYNPIEGFDLEKIEHERRKSHTSLFNESCQKENTRKIAEFGTAVWEIYDFFHCDK